MGAPLQAQRSGGSQRSQFADTTRRALERSLLYSEELGIALARRSDAEYFRWFLASLLFGARISETTAKNTYRSFIRHGLTNPQKILKAGWDFLVYPVMREGGYVRYDGRKSTQILRDCEMLSPTTVAAWAGCTMRPATRAILRKGCSRSMASARSP